MTLFTNLTLIGTLKSRSPRPSMMPARLAQQAQETPRHSPISVSTNNNAVVSNLETSTTESTTLRSLLRTEVSRCVALRVFGVHVSVRPECFQKLVVGY
jgi:hypothetical protein